MALLLSAWNGVGLFWEVPSSERKPSTQTIPEQATNMVLKLTSLEDLETWSHFLPCQGQEIKASPTKTHHPDLIISEQPLSNKHHYMLSNERSGFVGKNKPCVSDPIKYWMIRFTTTRWRCRGDYKTLLNIWTTYEISSLLVVRLVTLPTNCMYKGLGKNSTSSF